MQVSVDGGQSFRLMQGGVVSGALVSGKGMLSASTDLAPHAVCFLAYMPVSGAPSVAVTVGVGNWGVESCLGVASIGLLPPVADGTGRAGVIYRASTLHTSPLEPVVVTWLAAGPLTIDEAASDHASQTGATTLARLRRALAPRTPPTPRSRHPA